MCRIDAPFGNISFDEKKDPQDRFVQALDEFDVQGNLRILLIKHFSDAWQSSFRGISGLEEVLDKTKQCDSEVKKCAVILLSQKNTISHSILYSLGMYKLPVNDCAIIGFLKDIATAYYPNSPYGLFNDCINEIQSSYFLFISWLYGNDFCFSKEFFEDKSLNSLNQNERSNILWRYFNQIAYQFDNLKDGFFTKDLLSVASSHVISEPLSKDSLEMVCGLNFVKAWLKFDSQAGRLSFNSSDFLYDYNSPWTKIEALISTERAVCEETANLLNKWLDDTKLEFEKIIYVGTDLNLVSDVKKEQWARGLECYYTSYTHAYIYSDYGFSQLTSDDLNMRLSNAHQELCSELTPLQVSTWVKYSIDDDFQRILNSKVTNSCSLNSLEKFGGTEYFVAWKKAFLENLNDLKLENQLRILSSSVPFSRRQTKEFYSEFSNWWNEVFSDLVELKDFPKNLIPDWTVVAINRLTHKDLLPYIDKSIGILRGELVKAEGKEQIETYHKTLEILLKRLDSLSSLSPRKALRHRLLLMRSSIEAFSDESISKLGHPLGREGVYKWYDSLKQLSDTLYAYKINGNRDVTQDNYKQVQDDFYANFSHEFAEFCLSRLRLRKSEKTNAGKYDSSQVVEQSAIWRQGYLKALIELGFDLNGNVHKTVNFTKKSDPNEDVRAIASECYKAVRRHSKTGSSIQDIKRSIIAAEWWLLMCQRHELDLKVNHEEALKTRRNLMRNP